jgi:hypothetical protein
LIDLYTDFNVCTVSARLRVVSQLLHGCPEEATRTIAAARRGEANLGFIITRGGKYAGVGNLTDLLSVAGRPIGWELLADLRDAFTELELPFRVDLIDWATTGDGFRRIIEAESTVLQRPGSVPDRA